MGLVIHRVSPPPVMMFALSCFTISTVLIITCPISTRSSPSRAVPTFRGDSHYELESIARDPRGALGWGLAYIAPGGEPFDKEEKTLSLVSCGGDPM
ncbi:hypothetical protein P171DRAFT_435595 [Karstenula rhodostoma CBS 690.94]|uniref:Uncharacterized protein n=1 Tax=Karstenula rhodostoma CBS 690.94 TaxID=1392251 RepID=A0A9P4U7E3_9PLEO|nr:hypothetical protein P171DRAFT_435595 [Karstenula rhodostoma CBS 690.94]